MRVLVAYGTVHGSTTEVARYIADRLVVKRLDVDCMRARDVVNVTPYDVVVLGSAVHGGMWLDEMNQLLKDHGKYLQGMPAYIWLSCIRVLEPEGKGHILKHYGTGRARAILDVREMTAFAGKLDLNSVELEDRWTLSARYDGKNQREGDFRDWTDIRRWGDEVAASIVLNARPRTA